MLTHDDLLIIVLVIMDVHVTFVTQHFYTVYLRETYSICLQIKKKSLDAKT